MFIEAHIGRVKHAIDLPGIEYTIIVNFIDGLLELHPGWWTKLELVIAHLNYARPGWHGIYYPIRCAYLNRILQEE